MTKLKPAKLDTTGYCAADAEGVGEELLAAAFKGDADLQKIAKGEKVAFKAGVKHEGLRAVQAALYAGGQIDGLLFVSGKPNPQTTAALKKFQTEKGLEASGDLDKATLLALDVAMRTNTCSLVKAPEDTEFRVVADIADPKKTRLYVLDKNDKPVAQYLTSPGLAKYPTRGTELAVQRILPRSEWNPPKSDWAVGEKVTPAGLSNPLGILKLDLGYASQYIHGIPATAETALGRAASHGCLRMSNANLMEFNELYADLGMRVTLNRDKKTSSALSTQWAATGLQTRPVNAGREYVFGYLSGELGSLELKRK